MPVQCKECLIDSGCPKYLNKIKLYDLQIKQDYLIVILLNANEVFVEILIQMVQLKHCAGILLLEVAVKWFAERLLKYTTEQSVLKTKNVNKIIISLHPAALKHNIKNDKKMLLNLYNI